MIEVAELFEQYIKKISRQSSKGNQLKWENEGIWYKADFLGYEGLSEYVISHLLKKSTLEDSEFVLEAVGMDIPKTAEATLLYADDMHAHNTFESPENVIPVKTEVDISKPIIIPKTGILAIRF